MALTDSFSLIVGLVASNFLGNEVASHPGLDKATAGGIPCPAMADKKPSVFRSLNTRTGDGGIPEGGFQAVKDELKIALTNSLDFFPADFEPPIGPSYVGLFIRLAWHNREMEVE